MTPKLKKRIIYIAICILIPATVAVGAAIFKEKQYAWLSIAAATALSCLPIAFTYERKRSDARELVLISVMIALSVVGRMLFAALPGFKPVTAFVVITAMYLGADAGFITGAFTALISNFVFGQGPWTPFQMLAWGLVGLFGGVLSGALKKSRVFLAVYGTSSGVIFSLLMDVWTVIWADGYFNAARYAAAIASSLPFMAVYATSNVVFLLALERPIGRILDRLRTKYGI